MPTIAELKSETRIPVILVDHEGIITFVNPVFESAYGWRKEVLVGRMLTTIIPKGLGDAHHMGFSRFLVTGRPTILNQPAPLVIVFADGREVVVEHFIIAEKIDGNWVFGARISPLKDTGKMPGGAA